MHHVAVLCQDKGFLQVLQATLPPSRMDLTICATDQQALELALSGRCATLIVDFELPGAEQVVRTTALLPQGQRPKLLAIASATWPGSGQAFHSGANRILYRPLVPQQLKDALSVSAKEKATTRRKSSRYEARTLVYLEIGHEIVSAISINISEQGLAIQAAHPIRLTNNVPFRCVLPGADAPLNGHADVMWTSEQGRAGLFFSKISPAARKHLKQWLRKYRAHHGDKNRQHDLLPHPDDSHVSFSAQE